MQNKIKKLVSLKYFAGGIAKLCLATLLFATPLSIQAQNNLPTFPKKANTGDATQDGKNYDAAKKQWVSENPEAYKKMLPSTNKEGQQYEVQPSVLSFEEFNKMSPEKQAIIKANPDRYTIGETSKPALVPISGKEFKQLPAEKQAIIKANPDLYKIVD